MRAYFLIFTGARHASTVSLGIVLRERVAVLSLSAVILGGGLYPQPGVATRRLAAAEILDDRRERLQLEKPAPHEETVAAPPNAGRTTGRPSSFPRHRGTAFPPTQLAPSIGDFRFR